ncbi:hypothetical protein H113_08077 [Trichophyton rubrum MR1459]|nr:hypothetical protein H100_08031 [Trichophyton rubrum MR850]EZF90914.1 hypothetical protein H113_08077 [Trichophyton rubrum MR1459]EZG12480.1 hypothetical protein H107_08154 [Trichophyton rubrum CBS 202.88]
MAIPARLPPPRALFKQTSSQQPSHPGHDIDHISFLPFPSLVPLADYRRVLLTLWSIQPCHLAAANAAQPDNEIRSLLLGEPLIHAVSRLLDSNGVPNVLWGNYLLTVYGIPSLSNDASFAIPDDKIPRVRKLFNSAAGLVSCADQNCIIVTIRSRPPPTNHFHLDTEDTHIYLYPLSEVLPNIPSIPDAGDKIISASDLGCLPGPIIGYGKGAFAPEYSSVLVPSISCFLEACLVNYAHLARGIEDNPGCCHDLHYMSWASYLVQYVHPRGYLNLDLLQPVFRNFMINGFLENSTAGFVAAREKLIASV